MKIQVNARSRAHQFEAAASQKILHAGLAEAIGLPYECGSGTCGTCRARLIEGSIRNEWPEAPGSKYLKSPNEFLMCQCVAETDLAVEVASFVQELDAGACVPASVRGRIRQVSLLTHDVMRLRVDLQAPMEFDAGQFALVGVPGIPGQRGWSMVNYERRADALEFVVKKKPGGAVSEWLFAQPRLGVELELFGPLGSATFYPGVARNLLCIAGGSGIAGMMSILSRAAQERYFETYTGDVFFGVRTMRDAFFLDELAGLRERCGPNLSVTVALSEGEAPAEARSRHPQLAFDTGFVHEVAHRRMQDRLGHVRAYLAGPAPAVDAAVRMLLMARVPAAQIRYDKFC